jgi:hypothetical protein
MAGLPRAISKLLKIMAKKTEPKSKPATPAKRAIKPAVEKIKTVTAKAKPAARTTKPKAPAYTQEDVALRAYFISEKRRAHGLPGDEHQDWIEAERQLAAEAAKPKKTAKA